VAEIVPDQSDQLWISDGSFENVSGPTIVISNAKNPRTQVNLESVTCKNVPVIAKFRESGEEIPGKGSEYFIERFSHGLHIESLGGNREIKTTIKTRELDRIPAAVPSDIPDLTAQDTWVNVHDLGIKGDGKTDNTAALRKAIAEHRTLFFPMGLYNVSNTLKLRSDTVLIGLHPSRTVINLPDNSPEFQDPGEPKSLIEAPKGGKNIISGIGVYTGAVNARAVAIKWMAGAESMVNDVRLHGGHGTRLNTGSRDWRSSRDTWNSQPASLWVAEGGGGTFKDIWTPNVFAKSGMLITDTATSGRLYAMSSEHHVKNEIIIKNSSNWHFYALQFEEEREEGPEALPLEIDNSSNITFSNILFYRVVSCFVPFPYAIKITDSGNIRFRNLHSYSNSRVAFDNSLYAPDFDIQVRDPELAVLDYSGNAPPPKPQSGSVVMAEGSKIEKLSDGFLNIAGAAVNSKGELYFTDARRLRIYRWVEGQDKAELVREIPEQPMVLAFDKIDNLMVVAYEGNGTVLVFNPEIKDSEILSLSPQPAEPRPGKTAYLPLNRWAWISDAAFIEKETVKKPFHYLSPDNTVFIPASEDFTTGATWWGIKLADLIRSFRIAPAIVGRPFYVSNEAESSTFAFDVGPDGTLSNARLFAEEGGESLAVDTYGNVYVAAGNIYVFDFTGRLIDTINTPQRPISIVFGGKDRKTLFITSRDSLYSVRIR
jgi:sugar lactone lactonase YvrE